MKTSLRTKFIQNMSFETVIGDHKLVMDAAVENGGENLGPRPKALLLASLAGCTGMDVVSLLKKMRVDFDNFYMDVDGDVTDEHPKHFTKMHVKYYFKGKDLQLDKIEKAVSMSQDKYCGVSATFKLGMPVTWEIIVVE